MSSCHEGEGFLEEHRRNFKCFSLRRGAVEPLSCNQKAKVLKWFSATLEIAFVTSGALDLN